MEWTRKAVHIGGGVVALGFPWIFRSPWTVLALGAGFGAILWGTRRLGVLGSVHAVERRSEGGIFYPVAIVALFLIGRHQPVFYGIALGALVLSDALAALVGTAYGRLVYTVEGDRRSVEGSVVFLLVTFLAAHLPLLLFTDLGRAASVLIALQIALLVAFFEGISTRGSDNLTVPLVTYFLLVKMTPRTAEFIAGQLGAQLAIAGGLLLLARHTRMLTSAGAIAASLFFYGAWSLGGEEWTVAPALGLAVFALLYARRGGRGGEPSPRYQVAAVFYTAIVAGALFITNNVFEKLVPGSPLRFGDPFYPPYLGVLAAQLAMLVLALRAGVPWVRRPRPRDVALALAAGIAAVIPAGMAVGTRGWRSGDALLAAGICMAAVAIYLLACRAWRGPREAPWAGRLQAASALLAVAALLPPYLLPLVGVSLDWSVPWR